MEWRKQYQEIEAIIAAAEVANMDAVDEDSSASWIRNRWSSKEYKPPENTDPNDTIVSNIIV